MARCLKYLAFVLALFAVIAVGDEPRPRIAFISSKSCTPCRLSERDTLPELRKRGVEVIEYDGDRDDVRKLFAPQSFPAYYALSEIPTLQHHATADEVLDALCLRPQPHAQHTSEPVSLAAMLSRYLGPRSCLELALPAARDITLDDRTTLHVPKLTRADIEVTADNVVVITFEKPQPTASASTKVGQVEATIPSLTIKRNTITGLPDAGPLLRPFTRPFVFELKELPWD